MCHYTNWCWTVLCAIAGDPLNAWNCSEFAGALANWSGSIVNASTQVSIEQPTMPTRPSKHSWCTCPTVCRPTWGPMAQTPPNRLPS
eukprot:15232243-Alexandrium_andersonii.AAC.1